MVIIHIILIDVVIASILEVIILMNMILIVGVLYLMN